MSDARPLDTRPHQIFLSYASADRDVAQKIAEKLRQSNLHVWFDAYELQAGDSLTARIQDAIMAGDYLVVLLSPEAVRSQWMKRELNASLSLELQSRAITILPVLIVDSEIPSALAEIRHVDLRGDLDQGIERLVEQLNVVHSIDFSRLDAHAFESLIVELLEQIGFSEVVREWHTAERTFDIKATYTSTDPFDAEREEVWLVEVKFYRNAHADLNVIHQIVSYIERLPGRYKGLIITNGQLTSAAREWLTAVENKHRIAVRIIDGTELKRLLLNHPQLVRRYFHVDTIQ